MCEIEEGLAAMYGAEEGVTMYGIEGVAVMCEIEEVMYGIEGVAVMCEIEEGVAAMCRI